MIAVAAIAVAVAVIALRRPRRGPDRVVGVFGERRAAEPETSHSPLQLGLAALVMVITVATLGTTAGLPIGAGAALVVATVRRPRRIGRVDPADVPIVIDLLAGCLDAGSGFAAALEAAGPLAAEPLRSRCQETARLLRDGAVAEDAWHDWLTDTLLAPVARTGVRTASSGAAAADDLRRTAARLRARHRAELQRRVRQASVWLVVPLGVCFLPAFVLVAVVPVVIGLVPALR